MLDKKRKQRIINKYKTHDSDTGSAEVQIAILTEEMKELSEHLVTHRKDFSSRRGLIKKVQERRKLLRYLERENRAGFEELIKKLKIKAPKALQRTSANELLEAQEAKKAQAAQEEDVVVEATE